MNEISPSYINCSSGPVDILFFGEGPGEEEAYLGVAFVGRAGQWLRECIEEEFPGRKVCLDNVHPMWLGSINIKPDAKQLKAFKPHREKSLELHRPKVVVLLGEIACKAFRLAAGGMKRSNGKIVSVKGIDCPVVVAVHPAYVIRNVFDGTVLFERAMQSVHAVLKRKRKRKPSFKCLDTLAVVRKWCRDNMRNLCAVDIETSGKSPVGGGILCVSMSNGIETVWVPLFHKTTWSGAVGRMEEIKKFWGGGPRIVHNAQFELSWFRREGAIDPPRLHDTMLQAYLLDENRPVGLDYLIPTDLGVAPYWEHIDFDNLAEQDLEETGEYCCYDSMYTYALHKRYWKELSKDRRSLLDDVLVPVAGVLCDMNMAGQHVDRNKLEALIRKKKKEAKRKRKLAERAFPGVNFASPKQMRELVHDWLGLPVVKRTDKNVSSLDQEALGKLAEDEPRLKDLAEAGLAEKFVNRVLIPWEALSRADGKLHTRYLQHGTVTGRLASHNPNLQNVDREGEQRKVLTSRFREGKIIQADYSQHELRIFAWIAPCPAMLRVFEQGQDIHEETRKLLLERGLRVDRNHAKHVNFSILYDITAEGLYAKYQVPVRQGIALIRTWHEVYPELKVFWRKQEEQLCRNHYIAGLMGKRRNLRGGSTRERRQAYNFPIQWAAVLCSYIALVELSRELRDMKSLITGQIHDSILLDVPAGEVRRVTNLLQTCMVDRIKQVFPGLPAAIEVKVKECW